MQMRVWAGLGMISIGAAACSAGPAGDEVVTTRDPVEVAANVKVADRKAVRDVVVREQSLVFPRKGHEDLLDLEEGNVFVGDRATTGDANPYGFARTVKSVGKEGDFIVVRTEHAGLGDIFRKADLSFTLGADQPSSDEEESASDLGTPDRSDRDRFRTLKPLADSSKAGMSTMFSDVFLDSWMVSDGDQTGRLQLAFTNLRASASPHWDVHLVATKAEGVKTFEASVGMNYGVGGELCGTVSVDATEDIAIPKTKIKALTKTLFDKIIGRPITVMAGTVPVVFTARGQLELSCKLRVAANATIKGRVEISGNPTLKLNGREGVALGDDAVAKSTGEVTFDAQSSVGARCEFALKAGLYLYDTLGVYGALKPGFDAYVTSNTKSTDDQSEAATGCTGLTWSVDTEAGLDVRAFGKSVFSSYFQPFQGPAHDILKTCNAKDSCVGRKAGWYCSDLVDYSAIQCDDNEAIVIGFQCADPKPNCQRSGPNRTDPARMDGEAPLCGTAAPEKVKVEALTCPEPPAADKIALVGPCDEGKLDQGGYYCSQTDPHTIFYCGDGGQTQIDCGNAYCRPTGGSYANPVSTVGLITPMCQETVESCALATTPGWYCSPLTPSVAINCPSGSSSNGDANIPSEVRSCDPGLRCQGDARNHAKMDGEDPVCAISK